MKKIIIEGPDGVGKTTLLKKLAKLYGLDIHSFTQWSPNTYAFYSAILPQLDALIDRGFISEYVYSNVYNRKCRLSEAELVRLADELSDSHEIFILNAHPVTLYNRVSNRGEDSETLFDLTVLSNEYASLPSIITNCHYIDTTDMTRHEVFSKVTDIIDKKLAVME